ncbi:hypothetical protein HPB49_010593 [Dermacentor silvarum]|uniref:Uncharacterized protein n=1 Tax=Dermacentor silvarum TaxID=543639 RepID=A0ACB8DP58_DERSI|nr:hypothetical protein HPB49_010593 [Dermacentor silvarum]
MRVRFTSEDDLNLLKEVFAENPFEQTSRWRTIATNVGDAVVPAKTFSVRAVRERLDLLMAYFKARDEANLKKCTCKLFTSALVVPASVEPPPETAEDIFEGIYDDPPELPHCGDESEPAVVQEQPDCADVSGAGTPQSDQTLRNQTSRIQASNNAEPGPSKRPRVDEEQCLDCRPGPSGLQSSHIPAEVDDEDHPYPVKVAPFPDWLDFAGTVADEPVQDPDLSFLDL